MNKAIKIIIGIVGVIVFIVLALTIFIRFYLTDARIRTLVLPRAEEALGRKVGIGSLHVSFFSGITITDLTIPNDSGKGDLLKAQEVVIQYSSLPLLMKKLMVEVSIPKLHVEDKVGGLPTIDTSIDLDMTVDLAASMTGPPVYHGTMNVTTDLHHGKLAPHITAKTRFDQTTVSTEADIDIDKEQKIHLAAAVTGYTNPTPDVSVEVSGRNINIDYLLAAADTLQKKDKSKKNVPASKGPSPASSAESKPAPNPKIHGHVDFTDSRYQDLMLTKFAMAFTFFDNRITVDDLLLKTAGGMVTGRVNANLQGSQPAYSGSLGIKEVKIEQLRAGLRHKNPNLITGGLNLDINFAGQGDQWPALGDNLDSDGRYGLAQGKIGPMPLTEALAVLLDLPDLKEIVFNDMTGNFKMKHGKMELENTLNGKDVSISANGTAGLDGSLNLPVQITLAEKYSAKLASQGSYAKYLQNDQGRTSLKLVVGGTFDHPRLKLDASAVKDQAKGVAKEKAASELDRLINKNTKSGAESEALKGVANDLMKGIFGK